MQVLHILHGHVPQIFKTLDFIWHKIPDFLNNFILSVSLKTVFTEEIRENDHCLI